MRCEEGANENEKGDEEVLDGDSVGNMNTFADTELVLEANTDGNALRECAGIVDEAVIRISQLRVERCFIEVIGLFISFPGGALVPIAEGTSDCFSHLVHAVGHSKLGGCG